MKDINWEFDYEEEEPDFDLIDYKYKEGYIYVPYVMVESIPLIVDSEWTPRRMIKSRYAICK